MVIHVTENEGAVERLVKDEFGIVVTGEEMPRTLVTVTGTTAAWDLAVLNVRPEYSDRQHNTCGLTLEVAAQLNDRVHSDRLAEILESLGITSSQSNGGLGR